MGAFDDLIPGAGQSRRRTAFDDLLPGGTPAPAEPPAEVATPITAVDTQLPGTSEFVGADNMPGGTPVASRARGVFEHLRNMGQPYRLPAPPVEPQTISPSPPDAVRLESPGPLTIARELPGAFQLGAAERAAKIDRAIGSITGNRERMQDATGALEVMARDRLERRGRTGDSVAVQAAEALPRSLEYGAEFMLGGVPLAIVASQPDVRDSYVKYRKLGNLPVESFVAAQGGALAEVLPERIGWQLLVNIFKLPATTTRAQFLRNLGIQQAGEQAEEQITTLANFAIDRTMGDPTATPEKLWEEMKNTAQVTGILAPVQGGGALAARQARLAVERKLATTPGGRARIAAQELERAVRETEAIDLPAPIVPRETSDAPRRAQTLVDAARAALEAPAREAASERQLIEDAEVAGGEENRYDTLIAQHMERLAGAAARPKLPAIDLTGIPNADEAQAMERDRGVMAEDEAPLGVGVRGGAVDTLRPDLTGGVSPIANTVDPEAARERLGRAVAREDEVGAPANKRTVLKDKDGELVVGQITPEDWRQRAKTQLGGEELKRARNWYRQLHDTMTPIYGEEAPRLALGWLLSQKNASPSQGFMNVLRAKDKVEGRPGNKIAGLNEKAIMAVLQGKNPEGGIGAKLHDFLDSELGLPTRTIMGRDPRGGQPAAIDVWALRDHGRVDEATMNYVRKRFGEKAAARLEQDAEGAGEAQYEYGNRFYNDIVADLNKRRFAGGGWTAREVQAVGWVAMQKQLGVQAEFVEDIISKNTRRVSVGLSTAQGAPRAEPFSVAEARERINKVAKTVGAKIVNEEAGIGAYLGEVEGAIQLDALASPEVVRDFMDGLGYALQQTSVIGTRGLKTGKQHAFQISAPELKGRENEFFQAMRGYSDLAVGFQQSNDKGVPGVKLLNFEGHWGAKQLDELESAATQAAQELGLPGIDMLDYNVELHEAGNDWTKDPTGGAYLKALRDRGRLREAERLERELGPGVRSRQDAGKAAEEEPLAVGVQRSSVTAPEQITNQIDASLPAEQKVAALGKLTAENKPIVDAFLKKVDAETGARSKSNVKAPEKILAKARRPSIRAEKPWFDVEHVRDSFRFKSVLDDMKLLPELGRKMLEAGWEVVKVDTPKVLKPGNWGWRIVALDMRMPNGQLIEAYFPVAELEAAKNRVNHELFERWRDQDLGKLSAQQIKAFERDIIASRRLYDAAWKAYLRRVGQTEREISEALKSFERVLSSGSPKESISESSKEMPSSHSPAMSDRARPSDMTSARDPSGEQSTVATRESLPARREVGLRSAGTPSTRWFSGMTPEQRDKVRAAIESTTIPQWLVAEVDDWLEYPTTTSANLMMYWPTMKAVGVRSDQFDGERFRQDVAHELQHALDDHGMDGLQFKAFSHASPRLDFKVLYKTDIDGNDRMAVQTGDGADLMQEALRAFEYKLGGLHNLLAYPFNSITQYKPEVVKQEIFAQMGAVYFTDRKTMARHLPKWHDVMETIYGKDDAPTQSIAEARRLLQQALQVEGAGKRAAGRAGRLEDRAGTQGREPGEGVGVRTGASPGGTGGAAQPPAANGRGPAAGGVTWNVDQPDLADALIREFQNNQIDLKRVESAIEAAGGVIRTAGRPYLTEELYHGRVSSRVHKFERERVRPLLAKIKEAGLTAEQFGNYLWAKHAPERNAQMLRVNPTLGTAGSGMSDAVARQTVSDIRQRANVGALDQAERMVRDITKETRRILVAEGLEDQSTIDNWENAYKLYVPLMRDTDAPREGKGFKVQGSESKRAMGSGRAAVAVLAAVIAQHEAAVTRAEKAKVGRDLVKLAEEFPNEDFWRVDQPPTKQTINPTTGLVQVGIDPLYKFREDVFIVKDRDPSSGRVRERVVSFNPNNERALRLARAMQRLDVAEFGAATKIVAKVSRFLANLATQWNPVFWATNFVRDVQTLGINLQSTKLNGQAPRVLSRIPAAIAGIMHAEFADGRSTWAKHYREYQEAGGQTGWKNIFEDLIARQREIEKMIDRSGKSLVSPSVWGHWTAEQISSLNTAIENGSRLAAYVVAREKGIAQREAASIAKNLTVNFNRKGNRSSVTAAWYMFFNANVQGTARMVQALAGSRKAQAMVGTLVAFGAALELLNRLTGDDDRDEAGNSPYELIDESTKQRNWVILLPGKDDKGRARRITIPLPYGFNIFPNFGRLAMEAALGAGQSRLVTEKRGVADLAWSMAEVLFDSFVPLGQTTTPLQFAAPSVADPAVQMLENKTWWGGPMVPDAARKKEMPSSELYFTSNSETSKDLARWLNSVTGGNPLEPGAIDIHPGHIDHVFRTLTGGPGQFSLGMFDWGKNLLERGMGKDVDPLPAKRIPFVGKFYGEIDERELESKFYRIKGKADEIWGRHKALKKAGDVDAADALEEKEPALIAFAREAARATFVKDSRALRNDMRTTRELPMVDRGRAKEEIKREQSELYQRALEAYNAAAREQKGGR